MHKFLIIIVNVILVKNIYPQRIIGNSCTHERSNSPGVCKLLTHCKRIRDEVVFSYELPQTCGFQGTQPIVCCPNPRQPGSISETKCREYSSHTKEEQLCGHNIVKRVLGGIPIGRTEFPHMAMIGFQTGSSDNLRWLCEGSLISEQYILTAADCLISETDGEPTVVLLGVTNLNDTNKRQEIKIVTNVVHPEYKNVSRYHDIGLVKLEKPIEMSSYVRPACLNTHFDSPVGAAVATGWGLTHYAENNSEHLLKVTLDIAKYDLCKKNYEVTSNLSRGIINDMHICTGRDEDRTGICQCMNISKNNLCVKSFGVENCPLKIFIKRN
ncbi:serine protease snake-like isoform X2 [Zophobas morio]|uniref:serine protease snake-like isoform X2 n=1 Tax=Zophobas morio TaxID=2755281 RepID=UPI0030828F74